MLFVQYRTHAPPPLLLPTHCTPLDPSRLYNGSRNTTPYAQLKEKIQTLVGMCKKIKASKQEGEEEAATAAAAAAAQVARLENDLTAAREEVGGLREQVAGEQTTHESERRETEERLAEALAQVWGAQKRRDGAAIGRGREREAVM